MNENKFIPQVLETERLILRPLTINDKDAIFKWAGDPEVAKYMRYPLYRSPDDATYWLTHIYETEKTLDYGFVFKVTGELIGSGGLIFDTEENNWTLGYNIRRDMWGKGIVTEACRKIIEHARNNYDVKKIVSVFAVDNPKSGHVMEKLGMKFHCDCEYTKWDGSESFKAKKYEIIFE
nr:GNAT family N-acetyltransferase [uncultured Treponema sp.]